VRGGAAEIRQRAYGGGGGRRRGGGGRGWREGQRGAAPAPARTWCHHLSQYRALGRTRGGWGAARSPARWWLRADDRTRTDEPRADPMTADEPLAIASERLLGPAGLDEGALARAFGALMGPGIDFGDLYFQHARRESWSMEDGLVRDGAHSIEQGVGVRAISGEKTGFAYSDEIDAAALLAASGSARAIARAGDARAPRRLVAGGGSALYRPDDPVDALGSEAKVDALRRVDALLRAADPRVRQVMVNLSGGVDTILAARSDGVLAGDVRPL